MITIRTEQLAAFEEASLKRFEDHMVHTIADEQPRSFEALGGDKGARQLVRHAIVFGKGRRIETEGALAVLIELMVEFGEKFERAPSRSWAETILNHAELPPEIKVNVVRERLIRERGGMRIMPVGGGPSSRGENGQ